MMRWWILEEVACGKHAYSRDLLLMSDGGDERRRGMLLSPNHVNK